MMPSSETLDQESGLPKLRGLQFDADSSLVNLFQGSASFPVHLLSLPGRNGLEYSLSVFYQSNLAMSRVGQWSLDEERDLVGVGWNLPYEKIVISSKSNGTLDDNQYFWIMSGQPTPLLPTERVWTKGILNSSYRGDLDLSTVNGNLQAGFFNQQIIVSTNAVIVPLVGITPSSWSVEDPENETLYTLVLQEDGSILIQTGGISFELYNYQYWHISYYPLYERWEIVKNDGNIYTFGGSGESIDQNSEPNTQQYGVKWGNWSGPSTQTTGQQRYTKAWNLAKVQNSLGNYYILNYVTENQPVGAPTGMEYTKGCLVSKVKNDLGWTVVCTYEDSVYDNSALEAPKEYLDPHTDPSIIPGAANAYQSSYLTKYLTEVSVYNASEEIQTYTKFDYVNFGTENTPNYLWNSNPPLDLGATDQEKLAYGATYDRYLGSITQFSGQSYTYPSDVLDRYSSPGIIFKYNFDKSTSQPLGLITEIINPSGGKTILEYGKKFAGTDPTQDSRNFTVDNPFGTGELGVSRTWSGEDYVVSCWYNNSSNILLLNIYTWVGWWEPAFSEWVSFNASIDIDRVQVSSSADTFLLVLPPESINQNTLIYRFNRINLHNAHWTCSNTMTPDTYSGNQVSVVNGGDFFVVKSDSVVDMYTWDPLLQSWKPISQINIPSGITYYATATENYYILFAYNTLTQAGDFTYYGKDIWGKWTITKTLSIDLPIPHLGGFSYFQMSPSSSFVAMSVVTSYVPEGRSGFKSFDYEINILTWDLNYDLKFVPMSSIQNASNGTFTNIPSSLLNGYPGIGPVSINNSAIGTGPNYISFDGVNWTCQSVGIHYEGFSDLSHQYYWYAYDEQGVIKTENTDSGILSMVGNIDSSNPSSGWLSQTLLDSPEHIVARYDQSYPTNVGQYITIGGQVYAKSLNTGGWNVLAGQDFLNITQNLNAGESIDTTTLINSGRYIIFQILDQNKRPQDVGIVYFKNGTFVVDDNKQLILDRFTDQRVFEFFQRDHRYKNNINGKVSQIINGIITYPKTTSNLDSIPSITLNRYSGEDFIGMISGWTVQSITYDSGYDQRYQYFDYDQERASADGFKGTMLRFYKVTTYEGRLTLPAPGMSPNGFTTSYFYNGSPTDEVGLDITAYSMLDGQLYQKETYNNSDQLVSSMSMTLYVQTQFSMNPDDSGTYPLYGGVVQVASTTSTQEGVSTTSSNIYSLSSGNVTQSQSSYYDSTGSQTFTKKTIQYAYSISDYIGLWYQNNLTLTIQDSTYVDLNQDPVLLASSKIQTYQLWSVSTDPIVPAQWGTWKIYTAMNDTPTLPFVWWSGSGEPNPGTDGWIKSNDVLSRNEQGGVISFKNIEGISTTSFYDTTHTFTLATFTNAALADGINYTSFEDYQENPWTQQAGAGGLTTNDAFIGKQCYQLSATQIVPSILSQNITVDRVDQYYCFNLWYKTLESANPSDVININITSSSSSNPQAISLPLTQGEWKPFQWSVNLENLWLGGSVPPGPINLTLEINFTTSSVYTENLRVDHVFFTPTLSPFVGAVFDLDKLRTIGNIATDGMSGKVLYNTWGSQYTAIGPYNQTTSLGSSYSVRQEPSYSPSDAFPQSKPNLSLGVSGRGPGFYDLFMSSESLMHYSALEGSISNWSVVDNSLNIDTVDTPLQLLQIEEYSSQNIAIHLHNTPTFTSGLGNPQQSICLGITNTLSRFYVQWDGEVTNQWQLLKWMGSSYDVVSTNTLENWQPEWMLSVIGDRLFFTANGILIFNYQDADLEDTNTPILGINNGTNQGKVSFQNITVLENIRMGLSHSDGFGRPLQNLVVESSDSVIMTPSVYDALGRSSISLLPSRITKTASVTDPFAFDLNFITNGYRSSANSIWDGYPISGNITDYQTDGYPFSREIYEAAPLKRPVQRGAPGTDFAITNVPNSHITTYSYGNNTTDPQFLYALPTGQYFVTTVTDPDGNQSVQYVTIHKEVVGTIKYDASLENPVKSSQVYDIYGQIIGSIPPSYYQNNLTPQTNSFDSGPVPIPASATSYQYDFWGRQIGSSYPDTGISNVIYDNFNRPRFTQDAIGAEGNTYYNYIKYDVLGRSVELGVYTDTNQAWDPPTLEANANNPSWPSTNTRVNSHTLYDIDNTNGDNTEALTVGRPWQTTSFNSDPDGTDTADITNTYTYRTTGEILTSFQQATYDGVQDTSYSTIYTYTVNGRVKTVADNTTSAIVTYTVNMLGQTEEVDATSSSGATPKTVKANYTYDQKGNIENIELLKPDGSTLTTRNYDYLPNNWLLSTSDSYVTQGLKYTSDNCQTPSSGYYNGALSHNTVTYGIVPPTPQPSDYCYSVDHLNRVITANNDGGENHAWTFDDNSNFVNYVVGAATRNYTTAPDKNQLVSITNDPSFIKHYTYNAIGDISQVTDGTNTLMDTAYNNWNNKARSITLPQTNIKSVFDYNPDDQRTRKRVYDNSTLVSTTIHSGDLEITSHISNPTQTKRYIGTQGVGLVYREDNNTFYWALPDHLGSTRMIVDEGGAAQYLYNYDVYGIPTIVPIGTPDLIYNNLFTGQYYDSELGLYNYHARFYDPSIARFLQGDPAHQFYNPYSYVGGMPNMATDPSGMWSFQAVLGVTLGVLAVAGALVATVLTAGTATPILAAVIIGVSMGAGASSISYSATHKDDNVYESGGFWENVAIGGALGGVGGGAGAGIGGAGWTAGRTLAADVAMSTALGSGGGYVTNGVNGGGWEGSGALKSSLIGGAIGGGSALALGGLGRGFAKINSKLIRDGARNRNFAEIGSMLKGSNDLAGHSTINIDGVGFMDQTIVSNNGIQETHFGIFSDTGGHDLDPTRGGYTGARVEIRGGQSAQMLTEANTKVSAGDMGTYSYENNSCTSNVVDVIEKAGFKVPLYARTPFTLRMWWGVLSDTQAGRNPWVSARYLLRWNKYNPRGYHHLH
ncbi:MAG: RHS repeat-associated core domain-containing protein [Flavobacteriales bacterium]|nr:RHS repeat-associated core domain-containing protein [Flavobacteriales bacterium]